ncbi:MAG TPA: hypothetical protein ENI51_07980 [Candidatus Atribacteria bacterium]|nr:hypothetical protein [Candidatus Atribacteria bacterium]
MDIDIKNRMDTILKRALSFAGYVLYCYNPQNLNFKLIPLPRLQSTLRIKNTGEVFNLGKPSMYLEGKPLFIVVREIPFSIDLELDKNRLYEKGYSASEIDAKIHSIYTQRIFRPPRITFQAVILIILTILTSCLITYMLTAMYYNSIIEALKEGKEAMLLWRNFQM